MGQYRVEISKNGRAGCKNTVCKAQNIKIQKDELRFGTLVEVKDYQSWSWKHWGCVTPTQIQNAKTSIEDDIDNLEGYDEIPPEIQVKIKDAIEQGHVADEDWIGDVELNRPGKKGIHKRAPKKNNREAHETEDGVEQNDAKPETKKRSRGKKDAEDEEKPAVTKKTKTGPKKAKPTATAANDVTNGNEEEEQAPAKTKAAGRRVKKTADVATSDIQANGKEVSAPKKTRSGGKYKPAPAAVDEFESDVGEKPASKVRASRKKTDKGGEGKSAVNEPAKANGKTSSIPKDRKVAPKSAERVEDSDDEDVGAPVESEVVSMKPEAAEAKTSGKRKAKNGGAAKNKEKKTRRTSTKK